MRAIGISNGQARIEVRPDLGAGLGAYDVVRDGVALPVFRTADAAISHPFDLSNIVLVPFSGRLSGGGFTFDGIRYHVAPNFPGEKLPIHGSGFSSVWAPVAQKSGGIDLALSATGPGPFVYDAALTYQLTGTSLRMTLRVTNRAERRLPFGAGFHPWFVRDGGTRLTAPASMVWLEGEDHLPTGAVPVSGRPDMDFSVARKLPDDWINNGFSGWQGRARIDWPERNLSVAIEADRALGSYVLFSPSAGADFFCFEPVSHPVDAFNLLGEPEGNGLKILAPGETFSVTARFSPGPLI